MACCPTEDIITVDVVLANASFQNHSSATFEEVRSNTSVAYFDFTIVPLTEATGFNDFEAPNRRFLQSPDCDTSDPNYNVTDPISTIEIYPQQHYNDDFPAGSDMASVFFSVFLNKNPLRAEPELRVHGNEINIEAFNSSFLQYHDILRRNQEPFESYGLKTSVAPGNTGTFTFEVIIRLESGATISGITPPVEIFP